MGLLPYGPHVKGPTSTHFTSGYEAEEREEETVLPGIEPRASGLDAQQSKKFFFTLCPWAIYSDLVFCWLHNYTFT